MRRLLPCLAVLLLAACSSSNTPYQGGHVDALKKVDLTVGSGAEAKPGMDVDVLYTGWLYDQKAKDKHGKKFDSTADHGGDPFTFKLGAGRVIKGWDQGVAGMHVGGTRELIIPPQLGYGSHGAGGVIPPNAPLVFKVKLVGVHAD
ncbi:FKBP-type peptidyl-prolyl cis-trans isomerase [Oleiagrimonas sp. C23AA]|uniref:FKBP-type peptidyl-prolyl cis-trans isomerase n=1 Tax=Oleiagrimonas sp. C23AA TaxID=2719047 RepID=UPI00141F34EB|nr:FKBP-type peptidyl-prolyl cis-trans isomerase [Oleiagrimonas sp. C23AA]NII09604.1 FKBP-type peptidyl-prolyl cis-trans isomerase [Oleiagrimonas sp. C23AA]